MIRALVLKVTCGPEDAERSNQAFTVAAAAVAAGAPVSLWLTGEAVWFATPGRAAAFDLPLAAPLDSLLQVVLEQGRVTACTQCVARRDLGQSDLIDGIVIAGAARFVEEILEPGVQAMVY